MSKNFPDSFKEIADSMGIALYQRFSVNEASLFLRCQTSDVEKLVGNGKLGCINITENETQFFGYQLLEYLLENVTEKKASRADAGLQPERILRIKEVMELTGLSRTTIWRMERNGQFPARVSLGVGSVGWRDSELRNWIANRT